MDTKNIIIVILGILLLLSTKKCSDNKDSVNRHLTNSSILKDSIKTYKLKTGTLVTTVSTLQTTNKEVKKGLYNSNKKLLELTKKFKEVSSALALSQTISIDTTIISHDTIIPCKFKTKGQKKTDHYFIKYRINQTQLVLEELTIPIELNIVTGTKRKGLKTVLTTDVTSTNPYSKITSLNSQQTVIKQRRLSLAAGVGYNLLLEPQLTVGVYYSIIPF